MEQHDFLQGSPEWHAHRATHFNASDAPAMLGLSPYKTRSQLLDEIHTGITPEVDEATQRRFDEGHRFEALARPLAEKIIGKKLYPVVGSDGKYSASFDGLTMDEAFDFEHKRLNAELRRVLTVGEPLTELYTAQMEHQHMVSNAEKTLFMASDWEKAPGDEVENGAVYGHVLDDHGNRVRYKLIEELHCWYEPDPAMRERVVAGWDQFEKDLANHTPRVIAERPQAEVTIELPALFINAHGGITSSNMEEFGKALTKKLAEVRAIALVTDQDFSNAKEAAKLFREQCAKLKLAKDQMLSQTMSVGEAARMIDAWHEDLRVTALQLEKDVEREDIAKKNAMVAAAKVAYIDHIAALEEVIKPLRLNLAVPSFAEAIKNKRNYTNMQESVDTMLANVKASATTLANDFAAKQAWCRENADGYQFLFADMAQIITKADDDFKLLVTSRINAHKQAEEKRQEEERQRIRAEEEQRARDKVEAERKADEKLAQEKADAEAQQSKPAEIAKQPEVAGAEVQIQKAESSPVLASAPGTESVSRPTDSAGEPAAPTTTAPITRYFHGTKPTAQELVDCVAAAFKAPESVALRWLRETDYSEVELKKAA